MIELQKLRERNQSETQRIQCEILKSSELIVDTDVTDFAKRLSLQSGEELPKEFCPDLSKAFLSYEICRTMPHVAGPASSGNYTTLFPAVVEKCHHTLLYQQLNIEHEFKAYDPENIERDRIIGAIVNTVFPEWNGELPESAEDAPVVKVIAALWKEAEGVSQILSKFITENEKPAVSIEMVADYDNLAIYQPDTREVFQLLELPEEILFAISEDPTSGQLLLGETEAGVQLAWAYGKEDGEVTFRGTGVVQYPADRTAQILDISGSQPDKDAATKIIDMKTVTAGEGRGSNTFPSNPDTTFNSQPVGPELKPGQSYTFGTGRRAMVNAVYKNGSHGPDINLQFNASSDDPVYEFVFDGGQRCWRKKSALTSQ